MINIFLFGGTTGTGRFIKKNYANYFDNATIYNFSRKKGEDQFFDLNSSNYPKELFSDNDSIIISLAPIWLFVPFLISYLKIANTRNIKGVIVTSSTSVITKKYSWNRFDRKLSQNLEYWEDKLKELKISHKLRISLIRPTLIYGNLGSNSDRNISFLINFMRKSFFLFIPKETGLRQPLHFSQLGSCIMKLSQSFTYKTIELDKLKIYNVGGDEELSYERMLIKIKNNLLKNDNVHNCKIIKIPNRLFFILCLPILIFSPKNYEAVQRLSVNMSGFISSHKISGDNKKFFPVDSN